MRALMPVVLIACGLWDPPDREAVRAPAEAHYEAMVATLPDAPSTCDGVERMILGEDPRGCAFRPTQTTQEVMQVVSRCAQTDTDPELLVWHAVYGAWTGSPHAVSACTTAIDRATKHRYTGFRHDPPRLPGLKTLAHGARWHAALAALDDEAPEPLIRGWLEVERALRHCGEISDPPCLEVFAKRGVEAQRVQLATSHAQIQEAASTLARLRQLRSPPAP